MQSLTEAILQTIQQHAEWAWFIVFLIAFLESLAIIGILVPGWVLLVGVGTMIGADVLDFAPIVISAYLGAIIGEYLSFYVGFHYHEKILAWKIVAKQQRLIERSKEFFEKHGAWGVFIGRFIGPVRAVIPLVAGISEMPKRTFMWVNLSSGLIWAPFYLLPGILVGAAFELDQDVAMTLLFLLAVIGCVLWMAVRQSKRVYRIHTRQEARNLSFAITNSLLSWGIFIVCVSLLIKSSYFDFLISILVLFSQRIL
ncbi:MAG: DedA family protein [Kangiellaceae bacterium]|nr:DedA family protein [Kangiellaceae bacterium]